MVSQKFCYILVHTSLWHVYHRLKELKLWKVPSVVSSIRVVECADTCIASLCYLKVTQMNVQYSPIQ